MNVKKLLPIIGIFLFIGIVIFFDPQKIIDVFSTRPPLYMFLSFFALVPVLLIVNIQWQILLKKQNINVNFFYSLKNILIGFFYGFITPGGFGAYLRAYYLKQESKAPLPKCFSNIITYNSIDYLTLLVFGVIGGVFLLGSNPVLMLGIVVLFVLIFSLFVFFLRQGKSKAWFTRLIKSQIFSSIQKYMDDPLESFYEDLPHFKDVLIPFMLSFGNWLLMFTEMYFISHLFSIDIPYFPFIFSIAIANIVATIPIAVYGLGTRDFTLLTLFSVYPVARIDVISLSLFWFIIFWLTPSVIGALVTLYESRKFDRKLFQKG